MLLNALYVLAQTAAPTSQPAPEWFMMVRQFGPLVLIAIVFFYLMSGSKRKQDKERKDMLESMKKGDRVQTIGGILGTIVDLRDNEIVVKVDESSNTKLRFVRSAISKVGEDEEKKA